MKLKLLISGSAIVAGGILSAQFVAEKSIESGESDNVDQSMHIEVYDAITRSGLAADVMIKGLNARKTTVLKDITDTTLAIKKYRLYTVSCIKEGYMYYAHKFWPDEMAVHVQPVELKPLAIGLKTSIEDITFLGDETSIYHKSTPALEELVKFLEMNPQVKICIIGHGNGPDVKKGDPKIKKATLKRAEAVMDFLVQSGIGRERLAVRGAGNTEMIYPDPKTDWQSEANRRIEIEVIGL